MPLVDSKLLGWLYMQSVLTKTALQTFMLMSSNIQFLTDYKGNSDISITIYAINLIFSLLYDQTVLRVCNELGSFELMHYLVCK